MGQHISVAYYAECATEKADHGDDINANDQREIIGIAAQI